MEDYTGLRDFFDWANCAMWFSHQYTVQILGVSLHLKAGVNLIISEKFLPQTFD